MPRDGEALARSFYVGVLGMREQPKPSHLAARGGCWFSSGDVRVHLGVEPEFRASQKAHPAFLVSSLGEAITALDAARVEVITDQPLQGFARIYCFDPFGNRIELMERLRQDLSAPSQTL